jgi:hypothetical protein
VELYASFDSSSRRPLPPYYVLKTVRFLGLIIGEVVQTLGHSGDSVSLITNVHEVLIGDLYPVSQIVDDDVKSHQS